MRIRCHALDSIHQKLAAMLEHFPILNDLVSEQVNINAWPSVVSAFELLEQVLKALIQLHDPNYSHHDMKKDGHKFRKIFNRLKKADVNQEDVLRLNEGFAAYRFLHVEFPHNSLADLMKDIDGDYVKWRYYPLEGWLKGTPARASPHALLEIAQHAIHIIKGRVFTDHGLKTVGCRIAFEFMELLLAHLRDLAIKPDSTELIEQLNTWLQQNDGIVNGVSRGIRKLRREKHSCTSILPLTPYSVYSVISHLLKELERPNQKFSWAGTQNVQVFLNRAVYDDRPFVWKGNRFVNEE